MPNMTVLELGPSRVRRLSPGGDPRLDGEMVSQALAGIDETTVLIDERPVTVDSLWRHLISSSIEERSQPVTILHPSWWSPRRVARILDAASSVAAEVVATPRAALISEQHAGDVVTVVEFAEDVVAVCTGGGSTCRLSGWDDAASIAADITADRVLIDAPHGVHGAQELGATLRKALLRIGLFAEIARIEEQVVPSTTEIAAAEPMQQSRFPAQMVAATVVGIVVCGVGLATARPSATVWAVRAESAAFVEGRVSLRIPAGWTVTRVTAGPGS
ncbi:MAG TPA: hypothetical protein VMD51_06535, partial [Mycobacterium sp.]|nr:hypothetical protein [Mycobacterium sp.]